MNKQELVKLIKAYNSHEKEIFDNCVDCFLTQIQKELEKMYLSGNWAEMCSCTQIGIGIKEISSDFKEINFYPLNTYLMYNGKTIHDSSNTYAFKEFIDSGSYLKEDFKIGYFMNEYIPLLIPFYSSLKRKGFECYTDTDRKALVVTFDI